jgi:hypothetical protein
MSSVRKTAKKESPKQCIGAKCGELIPETGLHAAKRCEKACMEDRNLCLTCYKAEQAIAAGKKSVTDVVYQGRMHAIHPESRIKTAASARRVTAKKPSAAGNLSNAAATPKPQRALTESERRVAALKAQVKEAEELARAEAAAARAAEKAAKAAEKAEKVALTVVEEMTEDLRKEAEDELEEVEKQMKALTERRKVLTAKLGRTQRKTVAKKNSTRKNSKLNVTGRITGFGEMLSTNSESSPNATGFGASVRKNSSKRSNANAAAGGRNAFPATNYFEGNLF